MAYKIFAFLGLCLLGFGIWFGLKNQPDPLWQRLEGQIQAQVIPLADARDSVVALYAAMHPKGTASDPMLLLADPFMPTMTWQKFRDFVRIFEKQRFALVSSITGSGGTTLTNRAAKLLATSPAHLLEINCAPQFDLLLHEKYIGKEENGCFVKGELLKLWEKCAAAPEENFVVVVDNFNKINPETFFGPDLWEKLDNAKYAFRPAGELIGIPKNFYFIAVVHAGASGKIELNNEHFKRMGGLTLLGPETQELFMYWSDKKSEVQKKTDAESNAELVLLKDTLNLLKKAYYFEKSNAFISEEFGPSYQLGQWNSLRKLYGEGDEEKIRDQFVQHVNAMRPIRPLSVDDFEPIDYVIRTKGLAPGSSFLARQLRFLQDTGYFVELTMVGGTALLTAFFGWWFYKRREKILRSYGMRTTAIFTAFERRELESTVAVERLKAIKDEVDALVLDRQLNYTEALYFLSFIEDKVRQIESVAAVSESFLDLVNTFVADGDLSESEYLKLSHFLKTIRGKIPKEEYERYQNELNRLREKYGR